MQTNALQDQIETLKIIVESLLSVLHPGVVELIQNNHGQVASDKASMVINEASKQLMDELLDE